MKFFAIGYLLLGTLFFVAPRLNESPVFDGTSVVMHLENLKNEQQLKSYGDFLKVNWNRIWYENRYEGNNRPLQTKMYRPLQVIVASMKAYCFYIFHYLPNMPLLINAVLMILSGIPLFYLLLRLTQEPWVAAGSVFLYLFSTASITAGWVAISGEHNLVVILISCILLSYLKFKETSHWRWFWLINFLGFIGPLYKEYVVLTVYTVIAAEILSSKRNFKFLIGLTPLVFHCLYTSFFINALFYQNFSIFSSVPKEKFTFRWEAMNHYVFQLPPLLSLLGIIALTRNNFVKAYKKTLFAILFVSWCALFYKSTFPISLLPTLFVGLIILSAFWIHPLLAIWCGIGCAPYLLTFYGVEVHFMYSIAPFAAILLWHIVDYLKNLKTTSPIKPLFYFLLFIVTCDQAVNYYAINRSFYDYYRLTTLLTEKISEESKKLKKSQYMT
jgi:hypothetical protein